MWCGVGFCTSSGEPSQELRLAHQTAPPALSSVVRNTAYLGNCCLFLCIIVLHLNAFVICLFEVDDAKHSLF